MLAVAPGLTALGDTLAAALAGPEGAGWVWAAAATTTLAVSLAADLLILVWVIARLPRERLRAIRPALLAAVGFEVIEQVGAACLSWVTGSPPGIVFRPLLGLQVAIYLGRPILFATAWAATGDQGPPPDGPVRLV